MKDFIKSFRDSKSAEALLYRIRSATGDQKINIMEVCGGHTASILKYGIPDLLPEKIRLLSGPGCPVCVTPNSYIDQLIELSHDKDIIIASFGDMMRVPGTSSSLLKEKASGADVRVCYSPLDALAVARTHPNKKIIFAGVGFETTAPAVALSVNKAKEEKLRNFYLLSAHKTMPAVMKFLTNSKETTIDAFLCPGHVTAITGTSIYNFLAGEYHIPCAISGFEPLDVLLSIYHIILQIQSGTFIVENHYRRVVKDTGNVHAQHILNQVFEPCDSEWRGFGTIPQSGLKLRDEYEFYDAALVFPAEVQPPHEVAGCICGDIMRGVKTPYECKLFDHRCTMEHPYGPCMVSDEGSCALHLRYGSREQKK